MLCVCNKQVRKCPYGVKGLDTFAVTVPTSHKCSDPALFHMIIS